MYRFPFALFILLTSWQTGLYRQFIDVLSAKNATAMSKYSSIGPIYPDLKVVVNVPATELRLLENGEVIRRIQVSVGAPAYPTPLRQDQITQLVWNPWWFPPDSEWAKDEKVTPPGPKNPLGPVKMPLSDGVRMHGTTSPKSIGTAASHACIRMYNEDAKTLGWILQRQLTPEIDEQVLRHYQANGSRSFYVNLSRPVPVDFIYEPLEIADGNLVIHPDYYKKVKDKGAALQNFLTAQKIPFSAEEKITDLASHWPTKESQVIPLSELL